MKKDKKIGAFLSKKYTQKLAIKKKLPIKKKIVNQKKI